MIRNILRKIEDLLTKSWKNRGDCEKVFCWRIPLYKHLRISRLEFKVHICYLKRIKCINTLRKEEACL